MELFGKLPVEDQVATCLAFKHSDIQWKTAASHCFAPEALQHLHDLIAKVSRVMNVGIVITSTWREAGSLTQLKEQVFGMHTFAKYIIDVTPLNSFKDKQMGLGQNAERSRQIEYWLKVNSLRFNVQSHVIFDDFDLGFSKLYPQHFLQTNMRTPLTQGHIERAYAILTQPIQPS